MKIISIDHQYKGGFRENLDISILTDDGKIYSFLIPDRPYTEQELTAKIIRLIKQKQEIDADFYAYLKRQDESDNMLQSLVDKTVANEKMDGSTPSLVKGMSAGTVGTESCKSGNDTAVGGSNPPSRITSNSVKEKIRG